MKTIFKSLFFITLFAVILAILYFYIPASVKSLDNEISQTLPAQQTSKSTELVARYDGFMSKNLPDNTPALYFYWLSSQRKLSDLRVKRAINEVKQADIQPGNIHIWSLLNMGVVIKTNKHTIAIDTANLPFSTAHNELADLVDIFIVTHIDGDHYSYLLLRKAFANGKKIVSLEGFPDIDEQTKSISLASGETKQIDGVTISAYQTDHRGDGRFDNPCAWFVIEADGFKLLHTGDGRDFKDISDSKKVYGAKDFDVLLANNQLHPFNIRDLSPKKLIPLHLYKFMSGRDLYDESTIEFVADKYHQYSKDLAKIDTVYLLPGESYTYRK